MKQGLEALLKTRREPGLAGAGRLRGGASGACLPMPVRHHRRYDALAGGPINKAARAGDASAYGPHYSWGTTPSPCAQYTLRDLDEHVHPADVAHT